MLKRFQGNLYNTSWPNKTAWCNPTSSCGCRLKLLLSSREVREHTAVVARMQTMLDLPDDAIAIVAANLDLEGLTNFAQICRRTRKLVATEEVIWAGDSVSLKIPSHLRRYIIQGSYITLFWRTPCNRGRYLQPVRLEAGARQPLVEGHCWAPM